jgi:hypothetical protein
MTHQVVLLLLLLLALPSCGRADPGGGGDDDGELPALAGGKLTFDACGTSIITRVGATAPVLGQDQLGADPTPLQVHLGLVGDARTSIAVTWRSDADTLASTVKWGLAATSEHSTLGGTFQYQTGFNNGDLIRVHEVHLCGLSADTEYVYRVGGVDGAGQERWSPEYRFRTAPDLALDPSAAITVLVLGDSRGGFDTLETILDTADGIATPDLILFSGDAVTVGQLQSEWDAFFDAIAPHATRAPLLSTHGNHELNAVNYYSLFAMPGDEEDYSLDYGPIHLAVVNDSPADSAELQTRVADFLEHDLAGASAPWTLVMHHRPLYSSAANHGGDPTLRALFGPIYDAHHVDLVLNGHDHDYERTLPLNDRMVQATPATGTVYVVGGGAGADLYGAGTAFFTAASESTHNFVVLTIRAGTLDLKAYREDGSFLDSLVMTKE